MAWAATHETLCLAARNPVITILLLSPITPRLRKGGLQICGIATASGDVFGRAGTICPTLCVIRVRGLDDSAGLAGVSAASSASHLLLVVDEIDQHIVSERLGRGEEGATSVDRGQLLDEAFQ